ncbi:hypothetical protein BGZ63DRAFT_390052 [Mariannaea sp. PMI_226]|nr:hypothetical protein BGZ63DRAFT_390052 [Mariannaea sp. PMI_226]
MLDGRLAILPDTGQGPYEISSTPRVQSRPIPNTIPSAGSQQPYQSGSMPSYRAYSPAGQNQFESNASNTMALEGALFATMKMDPKHMPASPTGPTMPSDSQRSSMTPDPKLSHTQPQTHQQVTQLTHRHNSKPSLQKTLQNVPQEEMKHTPRDPPQIRRTEKLIEPAETRPPVGESEPEPEESTESEPDSESNPSDERGRLTGPSRENERLVEQNSNPDTQVHEQKSGRMSRLRDKVKSKRESVDKSKKQISKTASYNSYDGSLSVDNKRLIRFMTDYKVPKNEYLDPLSRLLEWIPKKLADLNRQLSDKQDVIEEQNKLLKSRSDSILALKKKLEAAEKAEQKVQSLWIDATTKADKAERFVKVIDKKWKDEIAYSQVVEANLKTRDSELAQAKQERDKALFDVQQLEADQQHKKQEFEQWHNEQTKQIHADYQDTIFQLETTNKNQAEQYQRTLDHKSEQYQRTLDHNSTVHKQQVEALEKVRKEEFDLSQASIKALEEKKESEKRLMAESHQATTQKMQMDFQAIFYSETGKLNATINSLQDHMANLSRTSDYTPITDEQFKSSFERLGKRVNNLMSWVPKPDRFTFDQALDPTNYLARNAQRGGRIWPQFVRNLCWRTLIAGFFAQQLGFGALGDARTEGYDLIDSLRQLLATSIDSDPNESFVLSNKGLNKWRATTFDGILKGVRAGQQHNRLVRCFNANVAAVTEGLIASLLQISDNRLNPQATAEIGSIAQAVGELALEMGSQRAHVCLDAVGHGQVVVSGERFKDDAEYDAVKLTVDLMTLPCLRRLGDGRDDESVERVIVQGDVVSLKAGRHG